MFTIAPDGTVTDQGVMLTFHQDIRDMNQFGQMVMLDDGPLYKGYFSDAGTFTALTDVRGVLQRPAWDE